jgi:N-glycosylase/DNA lyase
MLRQHLKATRRAVGSAAGPSNGTKKTIVFSLTMIAWFYFTAAGQRRRTIFSLFCRIPI